MMRQDGSGAIASGVAPVEVLRRGSFDSDQVRVVDEGPSELTNGQSVLSSAWESEESLASGRRVRLENTTLLHLVSVQVTGSAMTLVVGRTDYGEFVGTRTGSLPRDPLQDRGLANPLGSSVVAVTVDGYVVVARRPHSTDINPGQIFLVGGFFKPSALDGGRGVFGGAEREMQDELGLGDGIVPSLHCTKAWSMTNGSCIQSCASRQRWRSISLTSLAREVTGRFARSRVSLPTSRA